MLCSRVSARLSTNANMTVKDGAEAMKLIAPIAHKAHTDLGFVAAQLEAMAESGIKGSEAGVALRSAYLATLAPKSTMSRAFLDAGVDLNKFRTYDDKVTPANYSTSMRRARLDISLQGRSFN